MSKNDFDLIISDYRMPNYTGLQLLEKIAELGIQISFILMSGNSLSSIYGREYYQEKHQFSFLKKGFKIKELIEIVNKCLK